MSARKPSGAVNVHAAKTQLSRLLKRVAAGHEVIIARAGTPVAKLVPFGPAATPQLGCDAGMFRVPDDFNAPLPEDVLGEFER